MNAVAPAPPDFHFCDPFFELNYVSGVALSSDDCLQAYSLMHGGAEPVRYWESPHNQGPQVFSLPLVYSHGSCQITIGEVDPQSSSREDDGWFDIVPDDFRGMALWAIDQCALSVHLSMRIESGGFVTRNISHAINYLWSPQASLNPVIYPKNATFFTVMVGVAQGGVIPLAEPGIYDPSTGSKIFTELYERFLGLPFNSPAFNALNGMMEHLAYNWGQMFREGMTDPWWATAAISSLEDPTIYGCDSNLGSPRPVDCAQLQYSGLGQSHDDVSLIPGQAEFRHLGTCTIGISASIPLTITWKQIVAAANDLIENCVNKPFSKALGGRAYHSQRTTVGSGGGGKRRDNTAADALPRGANITLFQQFERFSSFPPAPIEMKSCTWDHVLKHKDVRQCFAVHHRPNTALPSH